MGSLLSSSRAHARANIRNHRVGPAFTAPQLLRYRMVLGDIWRHLAPLAAIQATVCTVCSCPRYCVVSLYPRSSSDSRSLRDVKTPAQKAKEGQTDLEAFARVDFGGPLVLPLIAEVLEGERRRSQTRRRRSSRRAGCLQKPASHAIQRRGSKLSVVGGLRIYSRIEEQ